MSTAKKGDGTTKSFVEYKKELNTSDTRVAEIASAGASGNKTFIPRNCPRPVSTFYGTRFNFNGCTYNW